jgi:hypothetical protein
MGFFNLKNILLVLLLFCIATTDGWTVINKYDLHESSRTHYTIVAELKNDCKIYATQQVTFTNTSDATLEHVDFNLYANAFREDAKFKPIPDSDRQNVCLGENCLGDIAISDTKINDIDVEHTIGGADKNVLIIQANILPNQKVEISFDFVLTIPNMKFRLGYVDKGFNLGQWYPSIAVLQDGEFVANPYYNVGDPFYNDVADYNISLTTPVGYTLASSAKFKKTKLQDNLRQTFEMQANNIREFAMVLRSDYKTIHDTIGGVKLVYNYFKDSNAEQSFDAIKLSFLTFSKIFGKYPHSSLTVAQTDFLYGGMEYSGLVMIAGDLDRVKHREVIVHEIAHQWWYSTVGNNQVLDAWLDEALAEYSTTVFFELNPQFGISRKTRVGKAITAFSIFMDNCKYGYDKNISTIDKSLAQFLSVGEYASFVYAKGQVMMDTLRDKIGDKAFFGALRQYYQENKFKIATPKILISIFEQHSQKSLSKFFDDWLKGDVLLFSVA